MRNPFFFLKSLFRFLLVVGVATSLSACKPSVDKRAEQNDCGGIRRELQTVYVLAGWWEEGQEDITDKNGGALYRFTIERERGGLGMNNRDLYEFLQLFSDNRQGSEPTRYGSILVETWEQLDEAPYGTTRFGQCSEFIEEMLEDRGFRDHLFFAYSNPQRYDNYEESRYRP